MYRAIRTVLGAFIITGLFAGASCQVASAAEPDFDVKATTHGIAGLQVGAPGQSRVVIRANGEAPLVRLWGLPKDSLPSEIPSISVQLPQAIEASASGHTVMVTVTARRPPGSKNTRFGVVYATNEVGNSGWRKFDLSDTLQTYSFTYDAKKLVDGNGDYIGFLPDPDGTNGAVDIAEVTVTIVNPSAPASDASTAAAPTPPPASDTQASAAPQPPPPHPGDVIATAYYDLKQSIMLLPDVGQRGGIARLGDGLLYGAKKGRLFYIPDLADLSGKSVVELPSRPPFSLGSPKLANLNDSTLTILGVGAEKRQDAGPDGWTIYESLVEFDDKKDCVFIGLWQADITLLGRAAPRIDKDWQRIFRSKPCIPLTRLPDGDALWEAGGRIDFDHKGIIFSIGLGEFEEVVNGKESTDPAQSLGQDDATDYGKIVRIDRKTHAVQHIAKGFRNPEGLFVDADGTIYATEHGPQGGDEVNIIEQGQNYGWPAVTFGTDYGKKEWRFDTGPAAQGKYTPPLFAFVPSVGPSEILRYGGDEFPRWKGDLLMTSLSGGSSGTPQGLRLFRLHDVDGRILFSEPIYIGKRMRDIIEAPDGRLIISTDGAELFILSDASKVPASQAPTDAAAASPATAQEATAAAPAAAPAAPGGEAVFNEKCSSCHRLQPGSRNATAPGLGCIFDRKVASTDIFAYSAGLKARSSVTWDADSLDAFLRHPKVWAPGTRMEAPVLSDKEVEAVIAFLSGRPGKNCK